MTLSNDDFTPQDATETATEETTPLGGKRRFTAAFLALAMTFAVALGVLGTLALTGAFSQRPSATVALENIYRQAEHAKWMSGQYRDEAKMPSDATITAAYDGDEDALHKLNKQLAASARVDSNVSACLDLGTAYNEIVATEEGKEALRGSSLPAHYDLDSCYETGADTPFTPGNSQYYRDKNGK